MHPQIELDIFFPAGDEVAVQVKFRLLLVAGEQ